MKKKLKNVNESREKLRLFDDNLFYRIGSLKPQIMKEFLRLVLDDDTLEFDGSAVNIIPADETPDGLIIIEFSTYTKDGTLICFITDRYDAQNLIYKMRWYEDYKTMQYVKEETDYNLIPDMIFVTLMEKDSFKEKEAVYEMISRIKETDEVLDDGLKILFVNGEYKGDDKLGDYIHDFMCDGADKMKVDSIREYLKLLESEEGF
ncbi:MAG: hypothetical protein ACI4WM_00650 [Erysipelotrichaceae bacterium]